MDHRAIGGEVVDINIGIIIRGGEVEHQRLALGIIIGAGLGIGADQTGVGVLVLALRQADLGDARQRAALRAGQDQHGVVDLDAAAKLGLQRLQDRALHRRIGHVAAQVERACRGVELGLQARAGHRGQDGGQGIMRFVGLCCDVAGLHEALDRLERGGVDLGLFPAPRQGSGHVGAIGGGCGDGLQVWHGLGCLWSVWGGRGERGGLIGDLRQRGGLLGGGVGYGDGGGGRRQGGGCRGQGGERGGGGGCGGDGLWGGRAGGDGGGCGRLRGQSGGGWGNRGDDFSWRWSGGGGGDAGGAGLDCGGRRGDGFGRGRRRAGGQGFGRGGCGFCRKGLGFLGGDAVLFWRRRFGFAGGHHALSRVGTLG